MSASSPERLRAAVLGATGRVGQALVRLLAAHPRIAPALLVASERSAGLRYAAAVSWRESGPIPETVRDLPVENGIPTPDRCELVFSCLGSDVARRWEPELAGRGLPVVSNASPFRLDPAVPLVVPDINPDHLELVHRQSYGEGFLITNPNCVVSGLALVLAPLQEAFGLRDVHVTTIQAASGAGYPGVPSLDLLGNVVPEIVGEAEKIRAEPAKILGRLERGGIRSLPLSITAQTFRAPVVDGHLLALRIRVCRPVDPAEAREVFLAFRSRSPDLPSAPERPLLLLDGPHDPQPRLHADLDGGFPVVVGPISRAADDVILLTALVHNLVRGAAGGALLNAELLLAQGRVGSSRPPGHSDGGTEAAGHRPSGLGRPMRYS